MRKSVILVLVGFMVLASMTVGCAPKKPAGMPELYPCELTFTQEGKPVEGVLVNLYPEDASLKQWQSGGTTGADGKIELKTLAEYKGVPAGKYKVTATKTLIEDAPGAKITEAQIKNGNTEIPTVKKVYVDPKFEFENNTPLRLEVKEGKNAETIDLGKPFNLEEKNKV